MLALEHVDYQFNPSPFATCDLFVTFPDWAPINQWAPWLFEAYGDCSEVVWQFLGLSMPQWLAVIFAGNLVALALITIAQFVKEEIAHPDPSRFEKEKAKSVLQLLLFLLSHNLNPSPTN